MRLLMRLRRRGFGLRGRIIGVVVITTAVTLTVAAVVLLPRLENSLRNAAMKTLQTEVRSAKVAGEITNLRNVPYQYVDEPSTAVALARAEATLRAHLGATTLVLIGYIDSSGHGVPVVPVPASGGRGAADADAGVANSAEDVPGSSLGPLKDVRDAYLEHRTVYSFGPGDRPQVRAAIYLPGSVAKGGDAVLAVRKSIDEVPAAVAAVRHSFAIAVISGMLLTLILAIPLAATLVRRLRRLRQAALRLAVDGTGSEFPVDRARDEVGDLARSFAIVQRRLRQQEEARRAFVATASHELRTPLASLEGMLELLADDLQAEEVDLEDATALLDRARVQSRRLGRLAADLLDLSRLDAEIKLRSEPIELSELGRAVLAEFELRALERGAIPTLDDGGGGIWAMADPGSVARILRILLDNALRVAPAGTEVAVEVRPGPAPALSVVDQGPGIPPEERSLIFERFQRGRETGGGAGFGLGLAIGRELAERMGGSLALEDTEGPGARFTLTLRPAQAPSPDREPDRAGV